MVLQVVLFPPGRRHRRSVASWLLQLLALKNRTSAASKIRKSEIKQSYSLKRSIRFVKNKKRHTINKMNLDYASTRMQKDDIQINEKLFTEITVQLLKLMPILFASHY